MSLRFRIVFATACAVLVVALFSLFASHVRAEAEQVRGDAIARYGGEVVSLAVTQRALEPGDVVAASDVKMRDWLCDLAPANAITNLDDVVGREVTVPVAANAPVTELAFRDASDAVDVPSGRVAVSVPVTDKLGITRGVRAGATVAAYEVRETSSSLIAEGLTVLVPPQSKSASVGSQGQLTLAVAPEVVTRVLAASASGDLRIVMPAADAAQLSDSGKAPADLTAEKGRM